MNYPENSVIETDNCVYLKNGSVVRRYGIDFEEDYQVQRYSADLDILTDVTSPVFTNIAISEFEWTSVAEVGEISLLVVQVGNTLQFYSVDNDNLISSNKKSFSVDLSDYLVDPSPDDGVYYDLASKPCSFSSGFGLLFVTHPSCEPFYVSYDPSEDTITEAQIAVQVRDFERLDDGLTVRERPGSLTDAHRYNLYNQGWYIAAQDDDSNVVNVLTEWDSLRTDFPSNADIWWLSKNTDNEFVPGENETTSIGNTPAPNGHYIFSAFNTARESGLVETSATATTTVGAVTTAVAEPSSGFNRPSVTSFFAGRVWYAGVAASGYSSKLYFSKIVESVADLGVCYQVNDPTSEENFDILPSDGGVIEIPEMAECIAMIPVGPSLMILSTNGLWAVTGGESGFRATDYTVSKVSALPAVGRFSTVIAEATPYWWNNSGINTFGVAESGERVPQSITDETIQSVILAIPAENFPYIKGTYNPLNKTIHWVYRSTPFSNISEAFQYDKVLVLNLTTQAFYTHTITDGTPKISGVVFTTKSSYDDLLNSESGSVVKYVITGEIGTSDTDGVTIGQFKNRNFVDWEEFEEGDPFTSYFITGYKVRGELLRKFQANWMVILLSTQPDLSSLWSLLLLGPQVQGSCLVQGIWDYSNSTESSKYTSTQEVYLNSPFKDYQRRKVQIRGNGYSLQLKMKSNQNHPFKINGWATLESGTIVP